MIFPLPAAFVAIIAVLVLGLMPVIDPDFFWHVKTGELIRATGEIPSVDVFSSTAAGQPWVVQGWLSDVALDFVWKAAGVAGVRTLVAVLAILTWWVVYRSIRPYLARAGVALALSIATMVYVAPFVAPRPTMATMLGFAITLHNLLAFRRTGQLRWLLVLPPLFAIWPNLHFGVVTGFGLAGLFLLSDLLQRVLPFRRPFHERGSLLSPVPILIGLTCVVATGANPHGYGAFVETLRMTVINSATNIDEWQSPTFAEASGKMFFAAVCAFILARSLAVRSIHWLDIVVPLAVIGAGLSAVRHLPLMGIVLGPFVARAIANWEPNTFAPRAGLAETALGAAATRDIGPRVSSLLNIALVAAVGVFAVVAAPRAERHFIEASEKFQPSGAADFVARHDLKGRLFNTYNGGGYLIYRLYPQLRVFIDGRNTTYPDKVIDDYGSIVLGKPDWFGKLESYKVDIVICETQWSLRQLLLSRAEFRLVYEDPNFSVLVRDSEAFRQLPTVEPAIGFKTGRRGVQGAALAQRR